MRAVFEAVGVRDVLPSASVPAILITWWRATLNGLKAFEFAVRNCSQARQER